MKQNREKDIIRRFFKGDFSKTVQTKFRWWLLNNDVQKESEETMENIWNELPNEINLSTLEALNEVKAHINDNATTKKPMRNIRALRYAVAAVGIVLLVSAVTFFATRYWLYTGLATQEFVQVSVPEGALRKITLSDGTLVTVGAGSSIVYPKEFTSNKRNVFLIGQARFAVSKDAKRPFTVETQHFSVMALGTEFDLTNYPEENKAATTLLHGLTRVTLNDNSVNGTQKSYLLKLNQCLTYDKSSGKVAITRVNATRQLAWSEGKLNFDSASLGFILDKLQHHYGVRFYCSDRLRRQGSYNLQIHRGDSLDLALSVLSKLNHQFTWTRNGNMVEIKEKDK